MQFSKIMFNTNYNSIDNTQSFTFQDMTGRDCQIKVQKYISIKDKNDLIAITLQKAEEDGIYNEVLLDVYFHLNIIYLYTDLEFSNEDREDELELYDILETNDIIDRVIGIIGEEEYSNLKELLVTMRDRKLHYDNTAAAVLRRFITDLPKNAAAAREIVENFNPEQYQQVVDFATAANGGRNINTNAAPVNQETVPIKPPAQPQDHKKKESPKKSLNVVNAIKKD